MDVFHPLEVKVLWRSTFNYVLSQINELRQGRTIEILKTSQLLLITWERFPLPRSWGSFVILRFRSQSHGRNVFFNLPSHSKLHLLPIPCVLNVLQCLLWQIDCCLSSKWTGWSELLGQLRLEHPATAYSEEAGTTLYPPTVWGASSEEAIAYLKAGMDILELSQMCWMVRVLVV